MGADDIAMFLFCKFVSGEGRKNVPEVYRLVGNFLILSNSNPPIPRYGVPYSRKNVKSGQIGTYLWYLFHGRPYMQVRIVCLYNEWQQY